MAIPLNLLLITMDALRQDALGCYGEPVVRTPVLDRLAAEGVRFQRAYCTQPHCMPSRASILTGRYPRAHGVWDNGIDLPPAEISLFELLRQRGFQTASFGKFHFQTYKQGFYPDYTDKEENQLHAVPYQGFERIAIADNTPFGQYAQWIRASHPDYLNAVQNPFFDRPAGHTLAWKSSLPAGVTKTDWIAHAALSFFNGLDKARPFAAWISFVDPHHPYNPPAPFADWYNNAPVRPPVDPDSDLKHLPEHYRHWRDDLLARRYELGDAPRREYETIIRNYFGKVSHVDDRIGRILASLDRSGLLDRTLVVLTSDHGTPLCDFGLAQVGPYSFESNIKVPLICRCPAPAAGGRVLTDLISLVDLLPTFFDLIGMELPAGAQGRSFKGLLTGGAYAPRQGLLVENRWGQKVDGFKTLVTPDWKLSVYANRREGELYDLVHDPQERHNLYALPESNAVRQTLMTEFLHVLMETEDPLPLRTGEW